MNKKYVVRLTEEERSMLTELVNKGGSSHKCMHGLG